MQQDLLETVRLLGLVSTPEIKEVTERRRILAEGLCRLAGARTYFWSIGTRAPDGTTRLQLFLNGGWEAIPQLPLPLKKRLNSPEVLTTTASPKEQAKTGWGMTWLSTNSDPTAALQSLDACPAGKNLYSLRELNKNTFSYLGFRNHHLDQPFQARERRLVHLVLQNIEWIHHPDTVNVERGTVLQLNWRQRQVLTRLLKGKSRKSIAADLNLSEHTIIDYIRQIYRKLNVRNRSELLSLTIRGEWN